MLEQWVPKVLRASKVLKVDKAQSEHRAHKVLKVSKVLL